MEGMIFFFILLGLLIALIPLLINYVIAKKFEEIAAQKGYDSSIHSFAMCFWLGFIGYIYVLALPDLVQREQMQILVRRNVQDKSGFANSKNEKKTKNNERIKLKEPKEQEKKTADVKNSGEIEIEEDNTQYEEFVCPNCNNELFFTEEQINDNGEFVCPFCYSEITIRKNN